MGPMLIHTSVISGYAVYDLVACGGGSSSPAPAPVQEAPEEEAPPAEEEAPASTDEDEDGVLNAADNCPTTSNVTKRILMLNGDACDAIATTYAYDIGACKLHWPDG